MKIKKPVKEAVKAKTKTIKSKVKAKCKGAKCACGMLALGALCMAGCATSDSQQPAKSATMSNTFEDCIIVVAGNATIPMKGTNMTITADGASLPSLEMFTLAQNLESSGTESYSPSATQTPTNDVKPDVDVHYNDAIGAGSSAATSFIDLLTAESATMLKSYISEKKSGTITVTKKDGSTETVTCKDGKCTLSDGSSVDCSDGSCSPTTATTTTLRPTNR